MTTLDEAFQSALSTEAEVGFDALSERDRVLVTIWGLEADVNNGGFDQYFFNSSGDHAFAAVECLRRIGANAMADIVRDATSLFGQDGVPRDRSTRQDALDSFRDDSEEFLDALDTRFIAYPDDLSGLLQNYLGGL